MDLLSWAPTKNAAVCRAVAARPGVPDEHEQRPALSPQSGRTRSVVMTLGAVADKLCVRRLETCSGLDGESVELRELCEDIAVDEATLDA